MSEQAALRVNEPAAARRILVAEEDPERLTALVDRLKDEGFEVLSAQDGLEALDRAREEVPDAIVLNMLLRRIGVSRCGERGDGCQHKHNRGWP